MQISKQYSKSFKNVSSFYMRFFLLCLLLSLIFKQMLIQVKQDTHTGFMHTSKNTTTLFELNVCLYIDIKMQ